MKSLNQFCILTKKSLCRGSLKIIFPIKRHKNTMTYIQNVFTMDSFFTYYDKCIAE